MAVDTDNKIVQLCARGMLAEFDGNVAKAKQLFQEAWDAASDEFERFTAAHYLARNPEDSKDALYWNMKSAENAQAIEADDGKVHYPTLYLNIARSYEELEDLSTAGNYYQLAASHAEKMIPGPYRETIRSEIAVGLQRIGILQLADKHLSELIDRWCERRALIPLAIVLPAYTTQIGAENGRNKIISALYNVRATHSLEPGEQELLNQIIICQSAESPSDTLTNGI